MSETSSPPNREAEFTALWERAYGDVLRFIQRRVDLDQAEDVAAETFAVVWRRLGDLPEGEDAARAWLFGVARHVILNHRRGADRHQALGVRLSEQPLRPVADDEHVLVLADLQRAWRRLSLVHQEALGLVVFEDLDAPAASAVLGISPVAFRLRLSRARRALKLHLRLTPDPAPAPIASTHSTTERTDAS